MAEVQLQGGPFKGKHLTSDKFLGMSVAETWVEALQIDPEKLNEWSALAPDGVPMLVWCLQEGHISAEQYLAWAKQRFELPVIRAEYFSDAFDSGTALKLHKDVTAGGRDWTPWFFPVEKWENVTLVACVEPPPEFDEPGIRCVLADARMLKDAWAKFMAPTETTTGVGEVSAPEVPAGMEPNTSHTVVKPFKLSLDNLDGDNLFQHKEPNKEELYSGHVEEAAPAPAPAAAAPTPPVPEVDVDEEGSRMHTNLDLSKLAAMEPEPEAPRAPTPPVPASQPKPGAKPPAPKAAKTKTAKKAAVATISDEELEALANETFTHLRNLYKHCFLMKVVGTKAILFKWDSSLSPNNGGKSVSADLAFPTFFRILHKTGLPYHGYLVDSPAHRTFFAELKIKDLPGCVTALPIKNEDVLIGVLVGIGDEALQKLDILRKADEAAAKLIEALGPTWAEQAAA